jgi:ZIP family zinc transporter
VAYELVLDAFETSAHARDVALGLFAGCAAFFFGDRAIDRMGGSERKSSAGRQEGGSALAIVLGIVLDGIPECMVLGLTILEGTGVGVAFLAAVWLSNLPEAVAATSGLLASGWTRLHIVGLWLLVMLVSGLSALAGYGLFDGASPSTLAFVNAFAAGAILTMPADTMMPEAFEHGGKLVGVFTTIGFAVAFALTTLD